MTQQEFSNQMDRMKAVYSDKPYPPERIKAIWSAVKHLDGRDFGDVVTELIAENQYAPMLSKFREALASYSERYAAVSRARRDEWLKTQPDCSYCAKTGWVQAVLRSGESGIFAFRCHCPIGERFNFAAKVWSGEFYKTYQPLTTNAFHAKEVRFNATALAGAALREMPRDEEVPS